MTKADMYYKLTVGFFSSVESLGWVALIWVDIFYPREFFSWVACGDV